MLGISVSNHDVINGQVIDNWQSEVNLQRAELDDLQQQAEAKNSALALQLSKMQGRLLRVEALHRTCAMRRAASDEFNFDQPPAQGGPLAEEAQEFAWVDLQTQLNQLALQLGRRERVDDT